MAAATLPAPAMHPGSLTMEQYLRTSYKPDCDFVDGVLEERNVGEHPHSKIQILIGSWLLAYDREWGTDALVEQRIRVTADRVRVVDVCVLRADSPAQAVTIMPPMLCIEILSPEDRLSRAKLVFQDYRAMGVPVCWLIDPIYRTAYIDDAEGFRLAPSTERLEVPGTPIYLPLDELFARLD